MKKTAIVIGSTTGIGKATAEIFAKHDYQVIITSRKVEHGEKAMDEFHKKGLNLTFFQLDVTNEAAVAEVIQHTVDKFGKLDVIVNNAGISLGNAMLADTKTDEFRMQLDTNVLGVYYGMKYAIRAMLKTGGGSIVNLASIAGLNGIPYAAQYAATKHAVVGLTKCAAVEYATQGIRINAVAPGAIKTEILQNAINSGTYDVSSIEAIHPMNRLGRVEDIAQAIYFLGNPDNQFLTGTILNVDGGFTAK